MILELVSTNIMIFTGLLFQMHGILALYMLYRKQLIQNVSTYVALLRSRLITKLKHCKRRNIRKKRSVWYKGGRTEQWWLNMYYLPCDDFEWRKNFRMTKENFDKLCDELRPFISPNANSPNHRALTLHKKIAIVLYFLKDTGSIWVTANTFGVHQCTVSKVIKEVCTAIMLHLTPKLVKLPSTVQEMYQKASEFEIQFGMAQAFGCIDGTHILIKTPSENSQDFFCYKQFHSLNVQAVCDFRGLFMDVDCRWPGSCHDAKVFSNSMIHKRISANNLPITHCSLLPGYDRIPNYLIGDPAYPLLPHCMK